VVEPHLRRFVFIEIDVQDSVRRQLRRRVERCQDGQQEGN
jgi:hypothetical protein